MRTSLGVMLRISETSPQEQTSTKVVATPIDMALIPTP
jgi:biopolymer transport protein ExbB/TolQ